MIAKFLKYFKKSLLLAKIKFEPTFFQVLWCFAFTLPLFGEAGGKGGVRSLLLPPAEPVNKTGSDFSKYTPPVGKKVAGGGVRFEFSEALSDLTCFSDFVIELARLENRNPVPLRRILKIARTEFCPPPASLESNWAGGQNER